MNGIQKALRGCLPLLLAALLAVQAAALPAGPAAEECYNYTSNGEPVSAVAAYTPTVRIATEELSGDGRFAPSDLCVGADELYLLDGDNGRIYVLDAACRVARVLNGVHGSRVTDTLAHPKGLCFRDGLLYIADTDNRRILAVDPQTGGVKKEIADPGIQVLGEEVDFFPIRLSVDRSGRLFVVSRNVNRGLVMLSADGSFGGFIGAPKVKVDLSVWLTRLFATEEQLRRMQAFVPTEYNSVDMDSEGFVYATIGSVSTASIKAAISARDSSGENAPIRRLNAKGEDILTRNGFFPPVGDLQFTAADGCSTIADVAVRGGGVYTLLDSRRGRLFTYDRGGALLYILGGTGDRIGCFTSPCAVAWWNGRLAAADGAGALTLFDVTDHGRVVDAAVAADEAGDYAASDKYWDMALDTDANLYTAYTGRGKAEYRKGNYKAAMALYRAVGETTYYSQAKAAFRQQWLRDHALPVGIAGVLAVGALIYVWFFRRKKSAKPKKGGSEK